MSSTVEQGREAFSRRAWRDAYTQLRASDLRETEDLERLSIAAHLVGDDDECASALERAHQAHARAGDHAGAARCAFWLGFSSLLRGESARAGGWLARASRMVENAGTCAARGLLLVPQSIEALESGDTERATALANEMVDIAERCGDADLWAFGTLCRGEAAIARGDTADGLKALDEAMVSVLTDELSPMCTGIMYCAVIDACMTAFDVRRAAEWTEALNSWCAAQPDLVPYRGSCLVHRSQVLQAHGEWAEAEAEADRARQALSHPVQAALGLAHYQRGELHRLRGEFADADVCYRAAREYGHESAPGLALLRMATGDIPAAVSAIRRAVADTTGPRRAAMLAAAVEISLAVPDLATARSDADELRAIAAHIGAPHLEAIATCAHGAVLLAEGDAHSAISQLQHACALWHELAIPYDAARARALLATAYRAIGDDDAAELEFDTARGIFERLGAVLDLDLLTRLPAPVDTPSVLTGRECEVLRLIAAGLTNRAIASRLTISEHTVARHAQNIFAKLGLSTRAAATAYAYEHGVL